MKCEITDEDKDKIKANVKTSKEKVFEGKEKRKLRNRKSKENLTTEKVGELEEMKNSVSEWVDSVNHAQPIPQSNMYTPDTEPLEKSLENPNKDDENGTADLSALKPEYQNKPNVTNNSSKHFTFPPATSESSSQPLVKHLTTSELFDQVAANVKQLESISDSTYTSNNQTGSQGFGRGSIPPVSALNLLNTTPNTVPSSSYYEGKGQTEEVRNGPDTVKHQGSHFNGVEHPQLSIPQGHLNNLPPPSHPTQDNVPVNVARYQQPHPNRPVQPPPGFSPQFGPYQMFPQVATTTEPHMYPSQVTTAHVASPNVQLDQPPAESIKLPSNTVFMDRMVISFA